MGGLNAAIDCFVCRKHRHRGPLVPGGPVAEDDLVSTIYASTSPAPTSSADGDGTC